MNKREEYIEIQKYIPVVHRILVVNSKNLKEEDLELFEFNNNSKIRNVIFKIYTGQVNFINGLIELNKVLEE